MTLRSKNKNLTNLNNISSLYFIGIGGIGMSALARYFHQNGVKVSGYDRTATALTAELEAEGIAIRFEENVEAIPKDVDMVVYTPAIPSKHTELTYYKKNDYPVFKRSEVLGFLTRDTFTIAVAGSHGKTTVSSMIAHILYQAGLPVTAFIGGIMSNYNSNYLRNNEQATSNNGQTINEITIVEADEYDRSFLRLYPDIAVITAVDTDHLDIYGTHEGVTKAFRAFTKQVKPNGKIVIKHGEPIIESLNPQAVWTYHLDNRNADIFARQCSVVNGSYFFELQSREDSLGNWSLGMGGRHNIENALAATTVARMMGVSKRAISEALATFKGIKRRFEYQINTSDVVMIDDYAHHPAEIEALVKSARELYPTKRMTVLFQPHLFSRTQDLAEGFAASLSLADEVILLDIYPAREEPIEGVTSALIFKKMTVADKYLIQKSEAIDCIKELNVELFLTVGAGDIDKLIKPLKEMILKKNLVKESPSL